MQIKAEEVSSIIRDQIQSFEKQVNMAEVGTVLQVGDSIAKIYGLDNAMAGELLEFPGGIKGITLNLEEDNVGAVILGSDQNIKEGDPVKKGEFVAEVETEKVNIEIEAFTSGVLRKILIPEGKSAPVGASIALVGAADEVSIRQF